MSAERGAVWRWANGVLSWGLVAVLLVVLARNVGAIDPLWGGLFALVVVVAILPAVTHLSPTRVPPWPLLLAAALPLLVRAFGSRRVLDAVASLVGTVGVPVPVDGSTIGGVVAFVSAFADAIVLATLSLLVVTELQRFTSLRLTVRFAALFVVVATIGLVGFWTVARWVLDLYLSAGFLGSNAALMAEFLATVLAALVAGGLFAPVFCRPRPSGDAREPGGDHP